MVKTLSSLIKTEFQRIQFTPDMLPADLLGTLIYNQKTGEFDTRKGPIFSNIILADEPTGNLDYKTSKEIFSLFLKLKKLNKTIIFATHNRELANRADYKLFISDGNIKRLNER